MNGLKFFTLLTFLLAIPVRAQGIRPEQMFERGKSSLESGDTVSAVKRLKIASFGLLNDPEQYASALVYLSVALGRSGDAAGAAKVIEKLVEVERLEPVLASLEIPPMIYADFSKLASSTMTQAKFTAITRLLKNREVVTKQSEAQLGSGDRP